jgi:hypothetical protein
VLKLLVLLMDVKMELLSLGLPKEMWLGGGEGFAVGHAVGGVVGWIDGTIVGNVDGFDCVGDSVGLGVVGHELHSEGHVVSKVEMSRQSRFVIWLHGKVGSRFP